MYLTKSRFKLALECPTKLYFQANEKEFYNKKKDDKFLKELANGGFQVGALAQSYFPDGVMVDTRNHQEAFDRTLALLESENVTVFEAALMFGNCFVRVDVLRKIRNVIKLIEVKAKSYAPSEDSFTYKRKEGISTEWQPYIYDVAFQTWVARNCFNDLNKDFRVEPYLMLANKESVATVDGLNQRFYVDEKTREVKKEEALCTPDKLGEWVLKSVDVQTEVEYLLTHPVQDKSFDGFVEMCSKAVRDNDPIWCGVTSGCKHCEYKVDGHELPDGMKSGFKVCWSRPQLLTEKDFADPMAWEIWGSLQVSKWLDEGKFLMRQLSPEDLEPKNPPKTTNARGMTRLERQEIQRQRTVERNFEPHVEYGALQEYFAEWTYPLHCIDFETACVALPFHAGMRPYSQLAFQFSHHLLHEDGKVEHKTQFIDAERGEFPNFRFVRALRDALASQGTIFRYSHHENSVLCQVHAQLAASTEPDKKQLMDFIEHITLKKAGTKALWTGQRNMVDLCKVVIETYYSLYAKGSNSIKYILPAVINSSAFLQAQYGQPTYGTGATPSLNFENKQWIVRSEAGIVTNPYQTLEPVFSRDEDLLWDELLLDEDAGITEGGAAMAAFGKMQFTRMSEPEREMIKAALLRYCELDTLAMVMILEEFRQLANAGSVASLSTFQKQSS